MKRFRFPLQALCTLRQRQEHVALGHYGQTLRTHRLALDRVQQATTDLTGAWTTHQHQLQAPCPAAQIVCHQTQCSALQERQSRAQADALAAEHQLQQSFAALLEAQRQRKVVDRLRERRQRDFDRELARADRRFLDELAQRRSQLTLDGRQPG